VNLLTLLLQVLIVVAVSRSLGWVFQSFQQPRVVGEMAAGILLGPSLLGWLAPALSVSIFPPGSLDSLNAISQLGLVLFIFLVGLRLDTGRLRQFGRAAVVTSNASVAAPLILGVGLGALL
jgi:Kef-type K+ transport system membrane component KefB